LEKENRELGREIEENEAAQERTNAKAAEIFAFLDEVSCSAPPPSFVLWPVGAGRANPMWSWVLPPFTHLQVYAKWKELPVEDMQAWTLLTAETQSSDRR